MRLSTIESTTLQCWYQRRACYERYPHITQRNGLNSRHRATDQAMFIAQTTSKSAGFNTV